MNILLLAEVSAANVIGGAERVVHAQLVGLGGLGHHVSAVTRGPAGDSRPMVSVNGHQERRYFPSNRNAVGFVLSSLIRSTKAFDAMNRECWPDCVVIHQALAGLGPVVVRGVRVPTWMYVCHSLAHEEYQSRNLQPAGVWRGVLHRAQGWLRFRCERSVMRRCNGVIVLSEFMRQRVVHVHGIPAEAVHVIPGGVETTRFRPADDRPSVKKRLRLPPDHTLFLTVRNLVPRMGLETLIYAVAELGEDAKNCLFLLGGEGPLKALLEALMTRLEVEGRFQFLGFVPESRLPAYYQAADAVLMPTRELEGFGLVTIEALACGTPVLGTPIGAIPEVLAQVDPGLIAEGNDSQSLAKALRRLIITIRDRPAERERLSRKGLELVRQRYTWDQHNERLAHVLEAKPTA